MFVYRLRRITGNTAMACNGLSQRFTSSVFFVCLFVCRMCYLHTICVACCNDVSWEYVNMCITVTLRMWICVFLLLFVFEYWKLNFEKYLFPLRYWMIKRMSIGVNGWMNVRVMQYLNAWCIHWELCGTCVGYA